MDSQFEPMQGELADMGIKLNTVAIVPNVEQYIQDLKENTWSTFNTLSFKTIP